MYEQSLEYLGRAVSANIQTTVGYMQSSVIYRQIFASASSNLDLKEELRNAFGAAYVLLEASLGHLQRYEQMLSVSLMAIDNKELSYQDAHLFYAGMACLQLRQAQKALFLFERSMSLQKNNPQVYLYLSHIYQAIGKNEAAQELLKISENLQMNKDSRFPYDQNIELRYF
jgi:tetratricopeptide (TPR) repeat protein